MTPQVRKKFMTQNGRFIFYHRTNAHNAHAIIESGVRNSTGHFLNNRTWTGAWLSSIPIYSEHGAEGDALLMVKLEIDDQELARWEWAAEGRSYREWLIPANIINRCATFELVNQMDLQSVTASAFVHMQPAH
jgi:hypothetical protein